MTQLASLDRAMQRQLVDFKQQMLHTPGSFDGEQGCWLTKAWPAVGMVQRPESA